MRIVFAGTPAFAASVLAGLLDVGHQVALVLTQPDRPAGRGLRPLPSAVKQLSAGRGLEILQPASLKDLHALERVKAVRPEAIVTAAYGLILPQQVLDIAPRGALNVHASLLPRWRGAAPIQRAILAGDEWTGVTIMRMEEGLDTGPMLLESPVQIDGRTAGELTELLAEVGGHALGRYLAEPAKYPPVAQPEDGVTYASKIGKAEARLDFTRDAYAVERQVRAFNPLPGAWFDFMGERIKVLEAEVVPGSGPPGMVADDHLRIACGERAIRAIGVQRAGRSRMHADELLRGFPIPKGAQLNPRDRAE